MNSATQTDTWLEIRTKYEEWGCWHRATSGLKSEILGEACSLAVMGRVNEALIAAERAYVEAVGNMFNVEFRCVTKTTTVSFHGPIDVDFPR